MFDLVIEFDLDRINIREIYLSVTSWINLIRLSTSLNFEFEGHFPK